MNTTSDNIKSQPFQGDQSDNFETEQYAVLGSFKHDKEAFTQGLDFYDGVLYESTGGCNESDVRRVELHTGKVLQKELVKDVCKGDCGATNACFAEGLTIMNGKVFQLTWRSQKGFVYDPKDLRALGEFRYKGEGWGLTHDDQFLIMSNGSSYIQFLDPGTFEVVTTRRVRHRGKPLERLNELEYVKGEIYANIDEGAAENQFGQFMARIDPGSGKVLGVIDFVKLCEPYRKIGVLNGIVYDEEQNRLFITGKNWPKLFEICLK